MSIRLLFLVALLFIAGEGTVKAQNADSIVQKYFNATGGLEKWNSIHTIRMVGTSKMEGGKMPVTVTKNIGKAVRTDYFVDGKHNFEIVTTKEGWKNNPLTDKVEQMSEREVLLKQPRMLLDNSDILGYKKDNTKIEYLGKERAQNGLCYKIKFTKANGFETIYFFDVVTGYMVHSLCTIRQSGKERVVETDFKDYKKLPDGITMSMKMESFLAGNITFDTVEINKPVDEKIFKP